jgi:chromosome segregation ATPase
MDETRKLKQLQSRLTGHKSDLEILKMDVKNKQREINEKQRAIRDIKNQLEIINQQGLKVSEHAILRYFERVKGYNIEEIEKEILSNDLLDLTEKLGGNGAFPFKEHQLVLKNNTVVTIK